MTTTVGRVRDGMPNAVYIGRPGPWGNNFVIGAISPGNGKAMSRADVIAEFERRLNTSDSPQARWMRTHVHELKGKHLQCFCKPLACHGDVLAARADRT